MNVVLDTCAVLALADGNLPTAASAALRKSSTARVSVVTAWEVAIKVASGKLRLAVPPDRWFEILLDHHDLRGIPLDAETVCAAAALPEVHRDPFDRAIVALALATDSVLITSDERISRYPGVTTRW
jgi:PIN domain nuclease of toxin-antitoxin system